MIVVDTSALMAVVLGEEDADVYASVLTAHAGAVAVSATTLVESALVAEARQGIEAARDLTRLIEAVDFDVVAVDESQSAIAVAAWRRFGKGRHSAALNFGDCFSYALAAHRGAPLLFKGDDFRRTDIAAVL
ncbi:type II toxin-antitoxin system VapC family toxin [Microbacterium koreense]|uniref:Ribonuclease VapC n=1 Tax=Microbacterium koreense TaxID=323761 RepID=A0ABW2ZSJ1_9MICO